MNYVDNCREYFQAFEDRDLKTLERKYHSQIRLLDWEVSVSGKADVLKVNEDFFNSIDNLSVIVKKQGVEIDQTAETILVFNEIEVCVNQSDDKFVVVDVIEIEIKSSLIKSIRAYKQ